MCCLIRARVPLQDAWAQIRVIGTSEIHEAARHCKLNCRYHYGACTNHKLERMLVLRTSNNDHVKSDKMMASVGLN